MDLDQVSCWYYNVCSALTKQLTNTLALYKSSRENGKQFWKFFTKEREIQMLYLPAQSLAPLCFDAADVYLNTFVLFCILSMIYRFGRCFLLFYCCFVLVFFSKVICWFIYIFLHSFDTPDACNVNEGWFPSLSPSNLLVVFFTLMAKVHYSLFYSCFFFLKLFSIQMKVIKTEFLELKRCFISECCSKWHHRINNNLAQSWNNWL